MKAKIAEIFKSIQGEGIYQGCEQVFIRFFGCNLRCSFCDTKLYYYKEMTIPEVGEAVSSYRGYHAISLTGGEPLLQIDFLKELAKYLKSKKRIIYLETNGTLYNNLKEIIDFVDIIAMDFKLPSSSGLNNSSPRHRKFLKIGLEKNIFVKAVICNSTLTRDLDEAINIISRVNKDIPLILQPNFFQIGQDLNKKISCLLHYAEKRLSCVKVAGQRHKIMNYR